MFKKFIAFLGELLLIPLVVGAIAFFTQSLITTEKVTCELQESQLYTCTAQDLIVGLKISEVTAENVYDIDYDLKCSESSDTRSCTAFAAFQVEGGDPILLSKRYKDPDQVRNMTDTLKSLLAEKNASIDLSFPPSIFSMIIAGIFVAVFSIVLLVRAFGNLLER